MSKSTASEFYSWVPDSCSKCNCSTVDLASRLTIERLPQSNQEAKAKNNANKQYNMKEGLDYRHYLFDSARKMEQLDSPEYTT